MNQQNATQQARTGPCPFDYAEYPLPIGTVVDASAGTGKTYAVAAHVTLALATNDSLSIGKILVTTFTRNAAAELRDRVRQRIIGTAALLRGAPREPAERPAPAGITGDLGREHGDDREAACDGCGAHDREGLGRVGGVSPDADRR